MERLVVGDGVEVEVGGRLARDSWWVSGASDPGRNFAKFVRRISGVSVAASPRVRVQLDMTALRLPCIMPTSHFTTLGQFMWKEQMCMLLPSWAI